MPRRPAKVTQADIARAIRAAKAAGAGEVTVDGEGVIRIALVAGAATIKPTSGHDQEWTAVNTIIDENVVRHLLPQLRKAGARGIVEYPLNKIID